MPEQCASNDVTLLHYAGVGLFAEVARTDEEWPKAEGSTNAVVVLSLRMLPDVPATDRVFGALDDAVAMGREWIAARS